MPATIAEIQNAYNLLMSGIDEQARLEEDEGIRSYGGRVRAAKGLLVESIAKKLVEIAWYELGFSPERLKFSRKPIKIPLRPDYLKRVPPEVADHIKAHLSDYFYSLILDIHVEIDGRLVLGIECKAYTENAMLKRILVDFTLLKQVFPQARCVLIQLESQLGGDYSKPLQETRYGSVTTHALLSYFDVDLEIITLLEGERRVDAPIHKIDYYKPLKEEALRKAVSRLKGLLYQTI